MKNLKFTLVKLRNNRLNLEHGCCVMLLFLLLFLTLQHVLKLEHTECWSQAGIIGQLDIWNKATNNWLLYCRNLTDPKISILFNEKKKTRERKKTGKSWQLKVVLLENITAANPSWFLQNTSWFSGKINQSGYTNLTTFLILEIFCPLNYM